MVTLESGGENFVLNFLELFPSTTGIHELINKVRSTGSLLDKKRAKKKQCAYPRKPRPNKG
jgi:hypothetical protein